ncbi:hypothetical protein ASPCADRAFT_178959, partial [Aspergillus carbonarius ITEM 5010]
LSPNIITPAHLSSPQLTLSARPLSQPISYKRNGNCTLLSRAFTGLDPPLSGSTRQDRYLPWQHNRKEYRNIFQIARNRSTNNKVAEKITYSSNLLNTVTSFILSKAETDHVERTSSQIYNQRFAERTE